MKFGSGFENTLFFWPYAVPDCTHLCLVFLNVFLSKHRFVSMIA